MFLLSDILVSASISAAIVLGGLYLWKWSREHYRFIVSSLATFLGFVAWNVLQSSTGADRFLNIDCTIFPLSWADVGSGVAAFVFAVIALGLLTERKQPASQVVHTAAIAGILPILVDLFLL